MNKYIYCDNAATTKIKKEVLDEMMPFLTDNYGNASSIYELGRKSKAAIEKAREQIATIINAEKGEIYYTAGGSEANNLALKGIALANKNKGNHIITTKIEHPSVLGACKKLESVGFDVTYLDVSEEGLIDMEQLVKSIKEETILISVMYANNEIGTIQAIKKIGEIAKEKNIVFHTDVVQAIGNVKIDVKELNIDALSLSAHKFNGPKGIGVVYINKKIKFNPMIDGGHQEKSKRAGTENVAGIVGMAKALELAYKDIDKKNEYLLDLREYYIEEVLKKIPYSKLNGHRTNRLPGNVNFSFEFIEGEAMLLNLDMKGIYASSGSACTSGSLDPSHVLLAIGLKHEMAHRFT